MSKRYKDYPWWEHENPYVIGHWVNVLKSLPDGVFDNYVSSPPYYCLRDYGTEPQVFGGDSGCKHKWSNSKKIKKTGGIGSSTLGEESGGHAISDEARVRTIETSQVEWDQGNFCERCGAWRGELGLEPTPELFIEHLCDGFDEVFRVLKDTGSCWVNLGDSYASGGGSGSGEYRKNKHTQFGKVVEAKSQSLPHNVKNIPSKSLCQIPTKFADEMIKRGWILRNTIIWYKDSIIPSSANDRFTLDFEYFFFFVKSNISKYYYNVNTLKCQYDKPPSVNDDSAVEGVDWYWRETEVPDDDADVEYEQYIDINMELRERPVPGTPMKLEKKKFSYWKSCDYYFEQQFEDYSDKSNIDEKYTGTALKDYSKHKAQDPSATKKRVLDSMMRRIGRNMRTVWHINDDFATYLISLMGPVDFNKLLDGYLSNDMNHGSFFHVNPASYKGAHFAVYSPELIKVPIDACTPREVCKKCGLPRNKVYQFESRIEGGVPTDNYQPEGRSHFRIGARFMSDKRFRGWTDCGCKAGFKKGVVWDSFLGSGTTMEVARKLDRQAFGSELNPDYEPLIRKRGMLDTPTLDLYDEGCDENDE